MTTRISGGTHRGRSLKIDKSNDLRPTSTLVRSAIFSMLGIEKVVSSNVLDLFAGTGAMGIEALSRNANHVDFVEKNSHRSRQIRSNLNNLGFKEKSRVLARKVESAMKELNGPYQLIFADPPYNTDPWVGLMQELENNSLPSDDVLVVCEHISKLQLSVNYGNFFRSRTRKYGDTCISIYEL